MNREIKFRAWEKSSSQMINFEDIYIEIEGGCLSIYRLFDYHDKFEFDTSEENVVLMQFTGLHDKNGKEIYEGDIVQGANRIYDNFKIPQLVIFLNGCFMFGNWDAQEYFNRHQDIKVIGNVYENPELIQT